MDALTDALSGAGGAAEDDDDAGEDGEEANEDAPDDDDTLHSDTASNASMAQNAAGGMLDIVVLGDLFLDVVATGVEALPSAWGADTPAKGVGLFSGGSAANAATQVKSLRPEWSVRFFAPVGSDEADTVEQTLLRKLTRDRRVLVTPIRIPGTTIGTCIVLSGDADRTFVSFSGSSGALRRHHIPLDAVLASGPEHIHLGGLFNLKELLHMRTDTENDLLLLLADLTSKAHPNTTLSLDTNFDPTRQWGRPFLEEALRLVHVTKLNETEALGVSNLPTPAEACKWLSRRVKSVAIVTVGKNGCWVCTPTDSEPTLHPAFAPTSPILDATGAGDAFMAGFLSEWIAPQRGARTNPHTAVRFAMACGVLAIQRVGACAEPVTRPEALAVVSLAPSYS